jgi:GTP cyclohydrolase III
MESNELSTYYKNIIPTLIEKYEVLVQQCFEIMETPIDAELNGDKRFNELKSKRQASEDAKYYAKEIDILKNELNGVTEDAALTTESISKNWAKRQSKSPA